MVVGRAGTIKKKIDCLKDGGEWHEEPIGVCVMDDWISFSVGKGECECLDWYEGRGKDCICRFNQDGNLVGEAEFGEIEVEKEIEI